MRRNLLWIFGVQIVIGMLGYFGFMTTSMVADTIILTSYYFTIWLAFWVGAKSPYKLLSGFSWLVMVGTYLIGVFLSTIGMLGVFFASADHVPRKVVWVRKDLVVKEYPEGNATSSWSGVRVALYRRYGLVPFVERKIFEKRYIWGPSDVVGDLMPEKRYWGINDKPGFGMVGPRYVHDPEKRLLILVDRDRADTLHLPR